MGIKQLLKKFIFRLRGDYTLVQLRDMGLIFGENFNPQPGFNPDPSHCWLITIGDDVTFAPRVQVLAHDASMHQALGYTKIARVTIGDRVFIGAGSIVMPGVTIGSDVIVGAGSVVTKDIPDGEVWVGNPARKLTDTVSFLDKHREMMKDAPCYDESYTVRQGISTEKKEEQKRALEKNVGYVV